MSATVVMARFEIAQVDWATARRYHEMVGPALQACVDGYLGSTLWQNDRTFHEHVVLHRYDTPEAADRGLWVISKRDFLAERLPVTFSTPDVTRFRVQNVIGSAKNGAMLSLSVRNADPGYGDELAGEVTRIFEELSMLEGFDLGEVGRNDTLAEQVIGLAHWTDAAAFQRSIPTGSIYDVRLYRRVV